MTVPLDAGKETNVVQLIRERDEALEREIATADILRAVASSPGNAQPVFDAIVQSGLRLFPQATISIAIRDGDMVRAVAVAEPDPARAEAWMRRFPHPLRRDYMHGLAILDGKVMDFPDVEKAPAELSAGAGNFLASGYRAVTIMPMIGSDVAIGALSVVRLAPGPLSDKQREVLRTFAAQAVIAIENTRLLSELRERTDDLSESLEQQTATSEILQVISNSPTNTQPVFDTIVQCGVKLFPEAAISIALRDSDQVKAVAINETDPARAEAWRKRFPIPLKRQYVNSSAILDARMIDIPDVREAPPNFSAGAKNFADSGYLAVTCVPMIRGADAIGALSVMRRDPGPLSDKQLALVRTFAAQAVIAIENARLFSELRERTDDLTESLEYQTATSEILTVISRSPTDATPVFDIIGERAEKLCDADVSVVSMVFGDVIQLASIHGVNPEGVAALRSLYPLSLERETITSRTMRTASIIHVPDVLVDPTYDPKVAARAAGYRGCLGVPMIRDGQVIGAIFVGRKTPGLYTESQVQLLKTFADQAVIAIGNVRLFDEVKARTEDLQESLQQQTATADVLKVISRSTFDLQTVLDTLTESAARVCGADKGVIFQRDGSVFRLGANYGFSSEAEQYARGHPILPGRGSVIGRVALEGKASHIPDVLADPEYRASGYQQTFGYRTNLGVPLLREGETIGVFALTRDEVNPFTDKQIELVTTFADQAVIAIENARLFEEVKARTEDLAESLAQQTATADVLKLISRSTFDLQAVLQALVETAARLCDADKANITREKNGSFYRAEAFGFSQEFQDYVKNIPIRPERGSGFGRVLLEGKVIHIPDALVDPEYAQKEMQRLGNYRTVLGIPMMRENATIGVLTLTRSDVRPFNEKQIELATTFADQAAIAIENVRLFDDVQKRTQELGKSLEELRTAQDRLVQTEKLASLGQLTAGIAHEIKNPLNFVNNFSAISVELIDELREVLAGVQLDDKLKEQVDEIEEMLKGNLEKVVLHGKRADSIVKNMLLHSRQGSGEHRPIDINAVVEESLNLAYHGARAEKQDFNITLQRSFDPGAGEVDLFPQEFTRVLLNLISNGFYAATKRKADANGVNYEPTLAATTKSLGDSVEIRIRDNGTGIPPEVKEKMFNPFFTTKPAGEGTGLGLSLSYDIIVKQHNGSIEVDTKPGEFTEFRIVLPRMAAAMAKSGGQA